MTDILEQARLLCTTVFGSEEGDLWYQDWKIWIGSAFYFGIWSKWIVGGPDHQFWTKALFCFGLDLVILHVLQYYGEVVMGLVLIVCSTMNGIILAYVMYKPVDLLKDGTFVSQSIYTRISGSKLQATWVFVGQCLFASFYIYSLLQSLDKEDHEYLFWFAGYVSVQMTLYFARGHDSQLGHIWFVNEALYIFQNTHRLEFSAEEHGKEIPAFSLAKPEWVLRSIFGFLANMVVRDFVGYSVPLLLMLFHDPLNCVIYSIAVNFIVTMDTAGTMIYKVRERDCSIEDGRLLKVTSNSESSC
eukprot:TRINITY_DN21349_c0_g4_i1.p1 TRINITY_DN21349_c0_g4~~TRINITY_DN21349_c0_g4_i1.p1  ORF type:complete len:301 (+),score=20.22 TRINITY_DN21349_c0_g4_i1:241-1143(+)